jgi:hypothetical protein
MGNVNGRLGIIMKKNVMFCVAVVAFRKFFSGGHGRIGIMDVFPVFLALLGVAPQTVHSQGAFPEVKKRVGIHMAIHTDHLCFAVDIVCPVFRIDEKRSDGSSGGDLRNLRFAVARQAGCAAEFFSGDRNESP